MNKKERLYNVIKIAPVNGLDQLLPDKFLQGAKAKGKIQDREFLLKVIPLSYREYDLYNTNRYNEQVVIEILNNHVEPVEISYQYILKWPSLIKTIIDVVFEISGRRIESVNQDPHVLFKEMRKKRNQYEQYSALLDRLVLSVAGFDTYLQFRKLETLEERMSFAAILEIQSDVILEERWEANKIYKKGINLKPDKEFRKYFDRDKQGGMNEVFEQTTHDLKEKMKRDKKLAELGIQSPVDTSIENRELSKI